MSSSEEEPVPAAEFEWALDPAEKGEERAAQPVRPAARYAEKLKRNAEERAREKAALKERLRERRAGAAEDEQVYVTAGYAKLWERLEAEGEGQPIPAAAPTATPPALPPPSPAPAPAPRAPSPPKQDRAQKIAEARKRYEQRRAQRAAEA